MFLVDHVQCNNDECEEFQYRHRIFFTLASLTKKMSHGSLNLPAFPNYLNLSNRRLENKEIACAFRLFLVYTYTITAAENLC